MFAIGSNHQEWARMHAVTAQQQPKITDTTDQATKINPATLDWREYQEKLRNEQWQREDAIRKETQAREDSAVSRWVEDARNAGININALGSVGQAESGGGITNATGTNTTLEKMSEEQLFEELQNELDRNFNANQDQKERINSIVKSLIQVMAIRNIGK